MCHENLAARRGAEGSRETEAAGKIREPSPIARNQRQLQSECERGRGGGFTDAPRLPEKRSPSFCGGQHGGRLPPPTSLDMLPATQ